MFFLKLKKRSLFSSIGSAFHCFPIAANGFGVRGCDMDVFLSIPESSSELSDRVYCKPPVTRLPFIADLPKLELTSDQLRVTLESLQLLTLLERAKFVSRVIKVGRIMT